MGCGRVGCAITTVTNTTDDEMSGNLGVPAFPALASPQRAGGGKPRNKVALKPGRSLMDWIRLSKSKDLSGTGGRLQNVTPEELAKHDKEGDVWTAIRGKVYNVTAYAEYHPGGAEELMRAAGKDGTDLFNEVHRWVNYESMLESCLVGRLRTTLHTAPNSAGAPKRKPLKVQTGFLKPPIPSTLKLPQAPLPSTSSVENTGSKPSTSSEDKLENTCERPVTIIQDNTGGIAIAAPETSQDECDTVDNPWPINPEPSKAPLPDAASVQEKDSISHESVTVSPPEAAPNEEDAMDISVNAVPTVTREALRYDWFQSDKNVTIVVYTKWKGLTRENVILDKTGREFQLCLILGEQQYSVHVELEGEVTDKINVSFGASGSKLDVKLTKVDAGRKWAGLGSPLDMDGRLVSAGDGVRKYRACLVESRVEVTHDTVLFCVRLPPGSRMWVPAGHHVYVRGEVSGFGQVERPYTPVPSSLPPAQVGPGEEQGVALYLMIKVYPQGALTPVLGELQPGDRLDVRDYDTTLALPPLVNFTSIAFVVAGTGFTPVPGLVTRLLSQDDRKVDITVFFFNKQERDILWRGQLEELEQRHAKRLKVIHVLSDPGHEWTGRTGRIRREVVGNDLPAPGPVTMAMVCGPIQFNQAAVKVLQEMGYQDSMYYVF
ncbi:cytochrome b5 reductase 4-like isoform X1 [Branchiostoma lanceolatum]|uniref:cytochrome b5 reductase 4-like isoform X1 n=1 Tax=Branchiostoma lanceolatum TaxID=7740 RepID=UPI003456F377